MCKTDEFAPSIVTVPLVIAASKVGYDTHPPPVRHRTPPPVGRSVYRYLDYNSVGRI